MGLKDSYLFHQFREDEIEALQKITQKRHYPRGSILFYAGEIPRVLHVLEKGSIQILKHDPQGNEIHIAQFHPYEMIAEMAHFESIPYPATARCESDVEVFEIDFSLFKEQFLDNPTLAFAIIRSLTRKIKQLEGILQRSLVDDAQTQIARYMIENESILSTLTQRFIAERLALSPETISRIIRRFKDEGWVEVKQKKLFILDSGSLKRLIRF